MYYEEHRYSKALAWNDRALRIMPTCPLVLWDRAGILYMLDRDAEARRIWKRIVAWGPTGLRENPCYEGLRWARAMVSDARVRLGMDSIRRGRLAEGVGYLTLALQSLWASDPAVWTRGEIRGVLRDAGLNKGR